MANAIEESMTNHTTTATSVIIRLYHEIKGQYSEEPAFVTVYSWPSAIGYLGYAPGTSTHIRRNYDGSVSIVFRISIQ